MDGAIPLQVYGSRSARLARRPALVLHVHRVLLALALRRPCDALRVAVHARFPPRVAHAKRADVHPLGGGPLNALYHGTRAVQARPVLLAVGGEAVEEQSVTLARLDVKASFRTFVQPGRVRGRLLRRVRKDRVTTLLDIAEIHEHSGNTLAAVRRRLVELVVEKVVVWLVLLTLLVLKDLQALSVVHWDHADVSDALLDAADDVVRALLEESARARSYLTCDASSRFVVDDRALGHRRPGTLDEVVALFV